MTQKTQALSLDVVIFGGGVAGLWLLNRLRKLGYQAVLLEADALGAGQTRYAQGIIHGGTKYALTGKLTDSSDTVSRMPAIWRACLDGTGEIDLEQVKLLSSHQYLWSTTSLTSRMAGFFASKLMRSRTQSLESSERPELFRDEQFRGQVYRLDEPVLDTASLVEVLATHVMDAIYKINVETGLEFDTKNTGRMIISDGDRRLEIETRATVLAAGKGNGLLLEHLGRNKPSMQLRPLKMVMVRGKLPDGIYAHCLGASANPRITISSHYDSNGQTVWYLGGQLAEEGVDRDDASQIAEARKELEQLIPWLDFNACQWATLPIDRAEVCQADGSRPADAYADFDNGVITSWPTKLAMAPRLAEQVEHLLVENNIRPGGQGEILPEWRHPEFSPLPWQEEQRWNG